ncbi:MAG: RluA family pseudouridine synthase [Heliobacteriaceae bacterium]|nr:RluA family pseudouridine synthase [Heliobacteriaceae bacterium]MDD4587463.1 RluA family pseudouridine synthase [Heliobacteriaceae bacterium]
MIENNRELVSACVGEEEAGIRLDMWLVQKGLVPSRSHGQGLIGEGFVTRNGTPLKGNHRVKAGEKIALWLPEPVAPGILPEDIPLEIVYQDHDLAVVNKPAGLVVHPAEGHPTGTLVNALLHQIKDLSGINGDLRPGIVHRLDKDTSGLLVVAKNDLAHIGLAAQVKAHQVQRDYLAIVHGVIRVKTGHIEAPVGRDPRNRQCMAVVPAGKPALTRFRVQERYPVTGFSLVECSLETGRTHQIRVHLAYIGNPVAGDPKYGPRKPAFNLTGQALHAWRLVFCHPRDGRRLCFKAVPPESFSLVLSELRRRERQAQND